MPFFDTMHLAGDKPLPTLPKCGQCGLYKRCKSPKMRPTGRGVLKVLFVGEAPGEKEDEKGVQFVGKAGQLLRSVMDELKVELDDCWKTNAVICRPPGNAMDALYIESCRANLFNTINELQPNVIIPMGHSAVSGLLPMEWTEEIGQVERWVGWTIPSTLFNAWVCPTYHPSFILRLNDDKVARM